MMKIERAQDLSAQAKLAVQNILNLAMKDSQVVNSTGSRLNPQEREELQSQWTSINGKMVKVVQVSEQIGNKKEVPKWVLAFENMVGKKTVRFLSAFMVYTLDLGGLLSDNRHFEQKGFKERLVNEIFSLKSWQFKLLLMFLLKRAFGIYGFLPSLMMGGGLVAAKQFFNKIPSVFQKQKGVVIKGENDDRNGTESK